MMADVPTTIKLNNNENSILISKLQATSCYCFLFSGPCLMNRRVWKKPFWANDANQIHSRQLSWEWCSDAVTASLGRKMVCQLSAPPPLKNPFSKRGGRAVNVFFQTSKSRFSCSTQKPNNAAQVCKCLFSCYSHKCCSPTPWFVIKMQKDVERML